MIKNENYIQISGWMINELNLKGNELLIYALIHGFCQDGKSFFQGSLSYIAEWTNSTKQGVIKCLKSLIDRGLVQKVLVKTEGGLQLCRYCTTKSRKSETGSKQSLPGDQSTEFTTIQDRSGKQSLPPQSTQFTATGQQSLPNNTLNTLDINSTASESLEKQENTGEAAEKIIESELKKLFGGHLVFDSGFIPEIASLSTQFDLGTERLPAYLDYIFERAEEKKPKSLTNMYYKMAKSGAIMQDFILSEEKSSAKSEKYMAICPVCGNKAGIYANCNSCGFDMAERNDEKKIALKKQIHFLPEKVRESFEKEYKKELEWQNSVNFLEYMRNPEIREDFSKRIQKLYQKYGITA